MNRKNKNLTVTIDEDTQKMVKNLQEEHNINISALVRKTIKDEYDNMNKKYC